MIYQKLGFCRVGEISLLFVVSSKSRDHASDALKFLTLEFKNLVTSIFRNESPMPRHLCDIGSDIIGDMTAKASFQDSVDELSETCQRLGISLQQAEEFGLTTAKELSCQQERLREHKTTREAYDTALLTKHGLMLHQVANDGSCLFRAASHQLYGHEDNHEMLRAMVVDYTRQHKEKFSSFVATDFEQYLLEMAARAWGGEAELAALSELFDRPIELWVYDATEGAKRSPAYPGTTSYVLPLVNILHRLY